MNLILASTSPYRRRLLERLRLPFTCIDPEIEESLQDGELPQARACRLAREKALSAAETLQDEAIVIGSDQVACLGSEILHKPGAPEAAIAQLTASSGQTVQFWTGVSLWTSPGEAPTTSGALRGQDPRTRAGNLALRGARPAIDWAALSNPVSLV